MEMRTIGKVLLALLGVVVMIEIVETAFRIWAWRSRNPRALHIVTLVNKYVENPLQLRFSGRSGMSATVHHVGRRSGTPYATPVIAHRSDHEVIIPLPYGIEVDWLRNVLAAGEAVIDLDGRSLGCDDPAVVDIHEVVDLLPPSMVRTVRLNGAREALQLRVVALREAVRTT
jgi:deazaflavin-dependent oxidoreductase (nitroreductase family)